MLGVAIVNWDEEGGVVVLLDIAAKCSVDSCDYSSDFANYFGGRIFLEDGKFEWVLDFLDYDFVVVLNGFGFLVYLSSVVFFPEGRV